MKEKAQKTGQIKKMLIHFDSIISLLEPVPENLVKKKKKSLNVQKCFHCIIIIRNNCKPFKCPSMGES